ncbi:hypothetical protein ACQJBY_042527 [Aegilops geniculata]
MNSAQARSHGSRHRHGLFARSASRKRTRVPRSKSQIRPGRGGATTGCRPAVLLTGQAAFAVRSRCPPASTVWAGAPLFRRSAIESCFQSAASPRRPRLCTLPCSLLAQAGGATPLSAGSSYKSDGRQTEPCGKQLHQLNDVQRFSSLRFFARLISKHEATARWSGLGTMLIARVQGSREASGSVVLCMLMLQIQHVS